MSLTDRPVPFATFTIGKGRKSYPPSTKNTCEMDFRTCLTSNPRLVSKKTFSTQPRISLAIAAVLLSVTNWPWMI